MIEKADASNVVYTQRVKDEFVRGDKCRVFVDFDVEPVAISEGGIKKSKMLIVLCHDVDVMKIQEKVVQIWKCVVKICNKKNFLMRQYHIREVHYKGGRFDEYTQYVERPQES